MMNDTEAATQAIRDTIQRVYGDATQTVLDHKAAAEIIHVLRAMGWASLSEVAMLIEAAGGSVTVTGWQLLDPSERRVMRQDDWESGGQRFTVSVAS